MTKIEMAYKRLAPILTQFCEISFRHKQFSKRSGDASQFLRHRGLHGLRHNVSDLRKHIEPSTLEREFLSVFPKLVKDLLEKNTNKRYANTHVDRVNGWFSRVMEYNVPFGKRTRGLSVAWAYRYSSIHPDQEGIQLSYILGWCLEMLQAYILVVDDLMDNSDMRRGQPSWHRVDGIGNLAMNDACYIYSSIFVLLKKYFVEKSFYIPLLELVHDVNHKTIFGQCLDSRTSLEKKFESYNMELYSTILRYKAGFYVAYLPVKLGMMLAGVGNEPGTDQQLREVMFQIGELYQFQNDYNDCFGEAGTMGKLGNDIQNGKCTWNFIAARHKCTPRQAAVLLANYGKVDPARAKIVKDLYEQLQLPNDYKLYMKESYARICQGIENLPSEIPRELFYMVIKAAHIQI